MTRARRRTQARTLSDPGWLRRIFLLLAEVAQIIVLVVVGYLCVCLLSYSPADPGPTHTGSGDAINNLGGRVGAWIADLLFNVFGRAAYFILGLSAIVVWRTYRRASTRRDFLFPTVGFGITMIGASGLEHLYFPAHESPIFEAGGIVGQYATQVLQNNLGHIGLTILLLGLFIAGLTLFGQLAWFAIMDHIGWQIFRGADWLRAWMQHSIELTHGYRSRHERQRTVTTLRRNLAARKPPRIEPQLNTPASAKPPPAGRQDTLLPEPTDPTTHPELSLLETPTPPERGYSREHLAAMSQLLVKKLHDFNVDITVQAVQPGPVITRFEIEPAPGIKSSQIVGLANDLARALSVVSVRVVQNIPGKSVLGIEIPNQQRETVRLVEGLASAEYKKSSSPLTLVLGKDIAGKPVIADLIKMPHVLIAGTTGAGKSVCVNALILSLVYKSTPEQVRMMLVDPKFLELSVYDGIPHLLTPVVTDMQQAANALRWCITEMDRRFRVMAAMAVRNIAGYNKKVAAATAAGTPLTDPTVDTTVDTAPVLTSMPYIVVIVDELADLMMVAGKKIEEIITRIAQRARAAGIHLILATQRPSVDVVTGLIKANVPTRIAFQVSAKIDSRTVLDQMGAEQLLGQGDMLFLPPGAGFPQRVHGTFVSDDEIAQVVAHLKGQGPPAYVAAVTQATVAGDENAPAQGEADPLYDEAVQLVVQSGKASISAVQRALRVGYNRAARMIESMEQAGVVSAADNGKREVLVNPSPPAE